MRPVYNWNISLWYAYITLYRKHSLQRKYGRLYLSEPWVQEAACGNGSLHASRQNSPTMENRQQWFDTEEEKSNKAN